MATTHITISNIYPEFIPDCPTIERRDTRRPGVIGDEVPYDFRDTATFQKSIDNFILGFIRHIFHTNNIGLLSHIELIEITSFYNTYYSATCRFDALYDTLEARVFLNNIQRDFCGDTPHTPEVIGGRASYFHKLYYGQQPQQSFYVSISHS